MYRSRQEFSKLIADHAFFFIERLAFELVNMAREYNAALSACRFLGVPSPEAVKAWASGNAFWTAFEAYQVQCARLGLSPLPTGC